MFIKNKKIFITLLMALVVYCLIPFQAEAAGSTISSTIIGTTAAGVTTGAVIGGPWGAVIGGGIGFVGGLLGDKVISAITTGAIYFIGMGLAYAIGYIAAGVIFLASWLVDFALQINLSLLSSEVIKTGWGIILDFTNLGFILGIIIIAFATIFHLESYALKQTLTKLIVAALLVNFSLVIAGAFIDVSHIIAKDFNKRINENGVKSISTKIMDILNVQYLLSGDNQFIEGLKKGETPKLTSTSTPR